MNELIFRSGGVLCLNETFRDQPTSASITITDLQGNPLSSIDSSFTDIEDEPAVCDDLVIVLPETNKGARVVYPTQTTGTIPDMTQDGYLVMVNRGGRRFYFHPSEVDISGSDVVSFRFDEGFDFAIAAGDKAYGMQVSYDVDWSSVTSEFTGQVRVVWNVVVGGKTQTHVRVADIVRQKLANPASWADVIARRPDADNQLSEIADKEKLVKVAWSDIVTSLYNMGIRHNLIIPDNSTVLRDATVFQCLYNLVLHQGLPVPMSFDGQGYEYLDLLERQRERALGQLMLPIDSDEDGIIIPEEKNTNRRAVWLRRQTLRD